MAAQGRAFDDFRDEVRQWRRELAESIKADFASDRKRLLALERWRAWIAGGLAALAGLWALAKSVLPAFWPPRPGGGP